MKLLFMGKSITLSQEEYDKMSEETRQIDNFNQNLRNAANSEDS